MKTFFLTRSSFSQERLLPNVSIGSIVDGILDNEVCEQQNSERNVVKQWRPPEKLHWKNSVLGDEELGVRKESRLNETFYCVIFLDIYFLLVIIRCW